VRLRAEGRSAGFVEDRERAVASINVSRETIARLDVYADLILKWQKTINLISPSTVETLWTRHILDCAQLAALGAKHRSWADLGSGAGFPGLVIAILAMDSDEAMQMHLIESDRRKASFLREAVRMTAAPATVHAARAEAVLESFVGHVTAVTARALAPLPELLELAEPLLTTAATGFFPKGQTLESELDRASQLFEFEAELVPSLTDENGRILIVRGLKRRAPSKDPRGMEP
jgi:16S rRNA (guanine527-N7)-methyltransferase